MPEVELEAGTIEYRDIGAGPVVVLVHGLAMDGALWRHVVADLRSHHRCVLPTLPLGAHRRPMRPDADLSLRGLGRLLAEFLDRLDLRDATLCFNDWCGAQVMIADGLVERVGRLVLVSCEAFDNYPPGLPGRMAALSARLPGGIAITALALRSRRMRQLPIALGWMSKRGIPDDVVEEWLRPLRQREIRRDLRKYARDAKRGRRDLQTATEALPSFDRPVLVVWASEDRVMPPEHGRRLAELFPDSRLVEIADSFTLVPEDQPALLASHLRQFIADTSPSRGDGRSRQRGDDVIPDSDHT
jgi:pimeloyl-ACP methyl ester carboxylesterase